MANQYDWSRQVLVDEGFLPTIARLHDRMYREILPEHVEDMVGQEPEEMIDG